MKRILYSAMLIVLTSLFIISCDNSTEPPQPCNTYAAPEDWGGFFALKEPYTGTYTVTKTGDAVVNTIIYTDDEGEHIIEKPILPWTISVTINSNDTKLTIETNGISSNGGVESKIKAADGNTTINARGYCNHETE